MPIPTPETRRERGGLITDELMSPVRALDWPHPATRMHAVSEDHFVREF